MTKNNFNRRDFLTKSIIGFGAFGLIDLKKRMDFLPKEFKFQDKIIYRKLGNTGISIPIVSMGVMNAFFPELMKKSYEIGIRHFDTAANYGDGQSELGLGKAIKEMKIRDDVVISTKALYNSLRRGLKPGQAKERFLEIFKGSLKRLDMSYVDILYLHDCSTPDDVKNPGIIEALTQLKKEKKIRFAGVSSHRGTVDVLNAAAELGFHDVVQIAYNFTYSGFQKLSDAIDKASGKGIGIIAMKTQGGGGWWRDITKDHPITGEMNQTAALKWVLKNENITTAIPGFTNYDQMNQNFSVVTDIKFTDEEKEFLTLQKADIGMNFCTQCSECISECPKRTDIPTLMRAHMYAAQYRNFYQARTTLESIPAENGLKACAGCFTCSAKCGRSFDIAGRINELKKIYS